MTESIRDAAAVARGAAWILDGLQLPDLSETAQVAATLKTALAGYDLVRVKPAPFDYALLDRWQDLLSRIGSVVAAGENSSSGARNGSIWSDVRYDSALTHTFRHSATAQPLHTDGAYAEEPDDVVLFLCEHQAASGGDTIFVRAETVDEVAERIDPQLHRQLWDLPLPYSKAGVPGRITPVLTRNEAGDWIINWNYYRVVHEDNPEVAAFREAFQSFLKRHIVHAGLAVPVKVAPGEVMLFKDQRMLHGRNAFTPSPRCVWKCSANLHAA